MAGGPLVGTLCLNTWERIGYGYCSFDFVEAVIVLNAFPQVTSLSVAFFGDAGRPTALVVGALFLAVLKHCDALPVLPAGVPLGAALLLDALNRSIDSEGGGLGGV